VILKSSFLHDRLIAEIYRPGTIFLLVIGPSTPRAPEKLCSSIMVCVTVVQDDSNSSKLVPIEITHVTFISLSLQLDFRVVMIYWQKICVFRFFSHVTFGLWHEPSVCRPSVVRLSSVTLLHP